MSLAHKIIRIECVKNQFIENVESLYRIFYNSRKPFIYLLHTIKYCYSKKKRAICHYSQQGFRYAFYDKRLLITIPHVREYVHCANVDIQIHFNNTIIVISCWEYSWEHYGHIKRVGTMQLVHISDRSSVM